MFKLIERLELLGCSVTVKHDHKSWLEYLTFEIRHEGAILRTVTHHITKRDYLDLEPDAIMKVVYDSACKHLAIGRYGNNLPNYEVM